MPQHDSHLRTIGAQQLHPESLMMGYGYKPELSEGAIKCPIFMTSTFVFRTAEEGKAFFELAYGLRKSKPDEEMGLIYSRLNNPDLEIPEDRLTHSNRMRRGNRNQAADGFRLQCCGRPAE